MSSATTPLFQSLKPEWLPWQVDADAHVDIDVDVQISVNIDVDVDVDVLSHIPKIEVLLLAVCELFV